jgi:hypothetical protein
MARRAGSSSFTHACSLIGEALAGTARHDILADISVGPDLRTNLFRLRDRMRSHVWRAGHAVIDLQKIISSYDTKTRREGLHAMHDWDGIADHVNPDMIAIDVLHYIADIRGAEPSSHRVLAILLDYYFMYLLALLSLRIWDEGDADANLDRLGGLLRELQGTNGSGQQFAHNAETLILIATSHFELDEHGYDLLLERTRTLNHAHQTRVAVGHAPCLGSHLRFGFEATYGRDTVNMRNDNVADYPWLCFSISTLMREYERMREAGITGPDRDTIVEAMLNGLTPDARAFVGGAPSFLSPFAAELAAFREGFRRYAGELLAEFEPFRPRANKYSPLSFFFNFSHNVLKGTVVDALLASEPWALTINDLATGIDHEGGANAEAKERLARTLMAYARANPHKIRGKLMPVIVYDPQAGRQAFSVTMRKLKE